MNFQQTQLKQESLVHLLVTISKPEVSARW